MLCLLFLFSSFLAQAEKQPPIKISPKLLSKNLRAGDGTSLELKLQIPKGHYAYVDKFKFKWLSPSGLTFTNYEFTPITEFDDPFSASKRKVLKDHAKVTGFVEFPSTINLGEYKGKLEITYQICSKKYCFFPSKRNIDISFSITSTAHKIGTIDNTKTQLNIEEKLSSSIFLTFVFVFFMGILASFTPCIFPMIPITLTILGSSGKNKNTKQRFLNSLIYVFGISLTYAVLGVTAAITGGLFGSTLSSPYVIASISAIYLLMALSMFGLFEIQAPSFIRNLLGTKSTKTTYTGALISGLIAGIIASPCVGPVIVSILAYIVKSQNIYLGFFLMMTFAFGLGSIFILLGLFTNLQEKLPKAGHWMDTIKILFGMVMLFFAIYFLVPILHIRIIHAITAISSLLVGIKFLRLKNNSALSGKILNLNMIALTLMGILFGIQSILGPNKFIYPQYRKAMNTGVYWENWKPGIIAASKGQKLVFYFTADWCAACHELKLKTFNDSKIIAEQVNFKFIIYDATISSQQLDELIEKYKIPGLPTVLFFNEKGEWLNSITLNGFENPDLFLQRLNQIK